MSGTFTWRPDYPLTDDFKPKTKRATFGDGYSQRAALGINSNPATLSLTFSGRDDVEAKEIIDFLKLKAGHESFTWVDFEAVSGFYICETFGRQRQDEDKNTVTATFEQVYGG